MARSLSVAERNMRESERTGEGGKEMGKPQILMLLLRVFYLPRSIQIVIRHNVHSSMRVFSDAIDLTWPTKKKHSTSSKSSSILIIWQSDPSIHSPSLLVVLRRLPFKPLISIHPVKHSHSRHRIAIVFINARASAALVQRERDTVVNSEKKEEEYRLRTTTSFPFAEYHSRQYWWWK